MCRRPPSPPLRWALARPPRCGAHAATLRVSAVTSVASPSGVPCSEGGTSCQNFGTYSPQLSRMRCPLGEPVSATCMLMSSLSCFCAASVPTRCIATISPLTLEGKEPSSSRKYPMPPVMPAATLRPTAPSTTTAPPVIYSQQWSPTPSTTAMASELRTANRSPARPLTNSMPPVAPYRHVLPAREQSSGLAPRSAGGRMATMPPPMPLHTPSLASPMSVTFIPPTAKTPKLWPAEPLNVRATSPAKPLSPCLRAICPATRPHAARSTLMISNSLETLVSFAMAANTSGSARILSSSMSPLECTACAMRSDEVPLWPLGNCSRYPRSMPEVLGRAAQASFCLSRSARPMTSSRLLYPMSARVWRTSSVT
mmetsp:Transcript_13331/g.42297  ORF Transcript_13331/g.42297 Transcript_13331/m.42297 type:complete len:369 (-) Transcript_13331:3960-5066(-)